MATDTTRYLRTKTAYDSEDPKIEPGQFWIAKNESGKVLRRIRILALLPEFAIYFRNQEYTRVWLYENHPSKIVRLGVGEISTCPEFNLRYVYELESQPGIG